MRHLDLCSGIGGFALAARWMGWETVGFAEIDPFCCRVLEKHWPGVPNYGDIAAVPGGTGADIISAGIPCQPYSCAGKRLGAADDRDVNAARNIKAAGLAVLACGETVNPVVAKAAIGSTR